MKEQSITQTELAHRMHTSRTAVARVLDPKISSITLQALAKAAHAVNYSLEKVGFYGCTFVKRLLP
jgi:transcriptional regulator with XRE-family HTH domain